MSLTKYFGRRTYVYDTGHKEIINYLLVVEIKTGFNIYVCMHAFQ